MKMIKNLFILNTFINNILLDYKVEKYVYDFVKI